MLLDSNILIYASKSCELQQRSVDYLCHPDACISAITFIEVLGYHKLSEGEKQTIESILSRIEILPVSDQVIRQATTLRQQRSLSLGDAIIAATAIQHHQTLITVNASDFKAFEKLNVIDPSQD